MRISGGKSEAKRKKSVDAKIYEVPAAAPVPQPTAKRPYLPNGTKHISPCQADNIIEAARFASNVGMNLNAHCTIMWNGTDAQTDSDGKRFALVREGLSKALARRGIHFTAVWTREEQAQHYGQHAHMVFHLPSKWRKGKRRAEIEQVIERLVDRHGGGNWGDWTVKLTLHTNGDVRYVIKGGSPEVLSKYKVKRIWRKPQGVIFGKRCGTTQNIGPQVRERCWYG